MNFQELNNLEGSSDFRTSCNEVEDTAINFEKFSNKNINFLSQLFENGRIISWISLKDENELVVSAKTNNSCKMKNTNTNTLSTNHLLKKYIRF